jgi:hypothetical protein
MANSNAGRPTVMTKEVLQKLEQAWNIGATDRIACASAGIAESTLYNYLVEHPEYVEVKEHCKSQIAIQALNNTAQAMQGKNWNGQPYSNDSAECSRIALETSKWALTHGKYKADFAERTEVTGADGESLAPVIKYVTKEEIAEVDKHIDEVING